MKRIKIKQIDSFTDELFLGNPAAVVTVSSGLTVKQMKLIAREMNLSETAFIQPPKSPSAHLGIRWFTPTHEVDLCGHATIAAFHALAEEQKYGMTRLGKFKFKVETRSGILPVDVEIKKNSPITIGFGLPIPTFEACDVDREELSYLLGTDVANLNFELPIAKDKFQMIIPMTSQKSIFSLMPAYKKIELYCKKHKIFALTPITTETVDESSAVHSRCFVPLLGVNEDPVTGSSVGPMSVYLADHGLINFEKENKLVYTAEQGDCLERTGRVIIELNRNKSGYSSIRIVGTAVTVLEGEIFMTK